MKKGILTIGKVTLSGALVLMSATTAFATDVNNNALVTENEYISANSIIEPVQKLENISLNSDLDSNINYENIDDIDTYWWGTKKYEVTGDNINIRTGPGTKYTSVGKLYKGDIIKVKSIDNGWAKFKYNDQYRYVSANYVKEV